MDKDSTNVAFTTKLDTLQNTIEVLFDKKEDNKYKVRLLPNAVTDFFDNTNDTLNFNLSTVKASSLGNVRVNIKNGVYPLIVQLVDDKNEVKYEKYITKPEPLDFYLVKPNKYYIRAIFDSNKNKIYDTGVYLTSKNPERVSYSEKPIEVRVGWELIEEFILK